MGTQKVCYVNAIYKHLPIIASEFENIRVVYSMYIAMIATR